MATSRGYVSNDYQNTTSFHDLNDGRRPTQRITSIKLQPQNLEYNPQEIQYIEKRQPIER